MSAASELVDVVDEAGSVVGRATRAEVRAGNLRHRAVFVVVVTSSGEVVAHQRADWKDVWPSRWDVCFGGVVDAGEEFDAAAARELAEEAGVAVAPGALVPLGEGRFEDASVREIGRVYVVVHDGPFTFPDGEVRAAEQVPLAHLSAWVASRDVVDDSRLLVLPLLAAWVDGGGVSPSR